MQTYKVSGSVLRAFWFAMVLASIGLVLQVAGDDEWDAGTKFWIIAVAFALLGIVVVWAYRAATVVTPGHIALRGLLRTRVIPWSDVQAIAAELNPGYFAQSSAPRRTVNLYHRDGRRIALPHLNEKNLAHQFGGLDGAVSHIREAWEQGRGADWVPVPDVQLKAAERARYGVSPWVSGLAWAALSMPVVFVLFFVGLIGEVEAPWPFSLLFRPEAFLVVPTVVFFATSILTIVRRRRARPVV